MGSTFIVEGLRVADRHGIGGRVGVDRAGDVDAL
jgi:hypothetical protein